LPADESPARTETDAPSPLPEEPTDRTNEPAEPEALVPVETATDPDATAPPLLLTETLPLRDVDSPPPDAIATSPPALTSEPEPPSSFNLPPDDDDADRPDEPATTATSPPSADSPSPPINFRTPTRLPDAPAPVFRSNDPDEPALDDPLAITIEPVVDAPLADARATSPLPEPPEPPKIFTPPPRPPSDDPAERSTELPALLERALPP